MDNIILVQFLPLVVCKGDLAVVLAGGSAVHQKGGKEHCYGGRGDSRKCIAGTTYTHRPTQI